MRVVEDRDPSPSVASIDSQTVPTAVMVSKSVGYDAGKKTKGRKRFTMVDTLGLMLMVKVVAADVQERLPDSSEAFIHIAMIRLMLRRLA